MNNLDQIKERIRKLLNLANDDAAMGGEVRNAIAFAERLMATHHLSEADLPNGNRKFRDEVLHGLDVVVDCFVPSVTFITELG